MYSATRRELWRVGDPQYLIDGRGHNPEMAVDTVTAKVRHLVTHAHQLAGSMVEVLRRDDPGHEAVKPLLELQTRFMNRADSPYGYGAINGEEVPKELVEVIEVPAEARVVVLASDGYPQVKATLRESEAWLEMCLSTTPCSLSYMSPPRGGVRAPPRSMTGPT
jgi:translation initiation factor 2 alpha subunit (eIF-2alpha)